METLLVVYSALAVFGLGVTVVDLFGVFDQAESQAEDAGDAPGDDGSPENGDHSLVEQSQAPATRDDRGSYVAHAEAGTRTVAKAIGLLRAGVYFSLGAGPTGLFALLTGTPLLQSAFWAAGAGMFIAVLAKVLRSFVRRDLDSTIKPEELLMDTARITVSIQPGAMGKAVVKSYGKDTEIYVRCKDPAVSLPKGRDARIVDMDEDCYWVEELR